MGSLDGSSATITIGRTGYGTTPRIFTVHSPGDFARWCVASGALYVQRDTENVLLTNSKAIIRSGSLLGGIGADIHLSKGGTARVEDSTAEVSGGNFERSNDHSVYPHFYGGSVYVGVSGTRGVAEVVRSHVTVTSGTFEAVDIAGGIADSFNRAHAEALAEEYTATFTGGSTRDRAGADLYGGTAFAESHNPPDEGHDI